MSVPGLLSNTPSMTSPRADFVLVVFVVKFVCILGVGGPLSRAGLLSAQNRKRWVSELWQHQMNKLWLFGSAKQC